MRADLQRDADRGQAADGSVVAIRAEGVRTPFFCVHPASGNVFCGIKTGKVLPYNFLRHVAFDLLCSCVPRHDSAVRVEHVDGVFFDAIDQNVELFGCPV